MNERVPDSTGLPLRAMVMVLLFLGVILLLVGLQSLASGDGDDARVAPLPVTSERADKPEKDAKPVESVAVRVYNISEEAGAAARTADQIRAGGWHVTDVDNLSLPDVEETTVYFGDDPTEHEVATAVAEAIGARAEPRIPDLAEQPPGVIVVVAG